jgi:hypothetical protein
MIELDVVPPADASRRRPPAQRYRLTGLMLVTVLVLALAGAAPAASVLWRRAGLVPAAGSDVVYEVDGDRVYVATPDGEVWSTSAYALRPFRRLWTVSSAGRADVPADLSPAGERVLLHLGQSTTVIDARDGVVRWVSPTPVQVLAGGRTGLVQEEQFRPGSEYDESSGDPGPLYFSSTGVPHTRPPERTVVRGVDLATGRPLWSTEAAGSVFAAPATAAPATMVVVSTDRMQLRDAGTGALLRDRRLPRIAGAADAFSEVVGDLVTLRHSSADGDTVAAYGLDDLEPRWQRTQVAAAAGNTRVCRGVPCEQTPSALDVLDPQTGVVRWRTDGTVDVVSRGPYALEVDASGADPRPVRTVQPATGVTGADLRDWQAFARGPAGAPLVLIRAGGGGGTVFGLLSPGLQVVRMLGHSALAFSGCRADDRLVACRGEAGIQVWSYRA